MRSTTAECYVTAFSTRLGWMAFIARQNQLLQLVFGHSTRKSALAALDKQLLDSAKPKADDSPIAARLKAYAEGEEVDLRDIPVDLSAMTPFRRKVAILCRKIPLGKTTTYGKLAALAGSPGAARAVGSCMAKNRIPLVIPCHRVVASSNRIGNYSAPGGSEMKRRLLDMELRK